MAVSFVLLPSGMQAVGRSWVGGGSFSRIFPSDHDGAALPLPPSFLPSFPPPSWSSSPSLGPPRNDEVEWDWPDDGLRQQQLRRAPSLFQGERNGGGERKDEKKEKEREGLDADGTRNDPQVFFG